ncbi:hypothetical protein PENARI_c008G02459 [Penicillium arizonense]|uniref:BTB domain-containing protein n=1 Tax=Penicillium arizonense TaxID=1835702 RepID=A0A1F5LJP0_PENAI|nr:hypothetical protein PENARI_c008G02459 [Penicillium arizonense]OGE53428.1 hypothetical protein PENARI_c008G02459 [Penicillium arizonense]
MFWISLFSRKDSHFDQSLVEKLSQDVGALRTLSIFKPDFPVSPQSLLMAAKGANAMEAVLCVCKMNAVITADIIEALLDSEDFNVLRLLFGRHRSRFPITDMVLIRAALYQYPFMALEMRNSADLQIIWGNVWQSDCSETKLDASEVLTKHATLQVTESMMERIWTSGQFMAKTTLMI